MFNLNGQLDKQNFSLSSLASRMGLGDTTRRRENLEPPRQGVPSKPPRAPAEHAITERSLKDVIDKFAVTLPSVDGAAEAESAPVKAAPVQPTPVQAAPVAAATDAKVQLVGDREDDLTDAQRQAIERRKAAEATLREAQQLEEQLAAEAQTARAERSRTRLKEVTLLAEQAVKKEVEAAGLAREAAQRHLLAIEERKRTEDGLGKSRGAFEIATRDLEELARAFVDGQRRVEETSLLVDGNERRVEQCLKRESDAQHEASQAVAFEQSCKTERRDCDLALEEARERANAFGQGAVTDATTTSSTETAASLEERVTGESTRQNTYAKSAG